MSILNESRAIDLGLSSVKDNNELGVLRSIDFLTDQGTKYINQGLEPDAKRTIISIRDMETPLLFKNGAWSFDLPGIAGEDG